MKDLLLEIHSLSTFVSLTPKQTFQTYKQLKQFLNVNVDKISNLEYYNLLELNFYLALIMGNDLEAQTCLNRITDNFDESQSQRIAVLKATYMSVDSTKDAISYLGNRDMEELVTYKKRLALSRELTRPEDYISNLQAYLKFVPTDTETLAELGDTYNAVGHYDKAIFTYEEILLAQPFNYIVFGKLGELYHKLYKQKGDVSDLVGSLKQFLRGVELCSNFVKGWSGVYMVVKEISELNAKKLKDINVDYEKLMTLSKSKLEEIVETENGTYGNIEIAKKILQL